MPRPPSLVETLKAIIERSYGIPPVIPDIAPYIVGDHGFRRLYGPDVTGGARMLLRTAEAGLRASVYYPDALVRHLERFDPRDGVGDENIAAFAALIEEIDHLLTVAHRAAEGRPVTLLELEHHAGVTKYLVVLHYLGRQTGRRRLPEALRVWARHHLFERYSAGDGAEERRYRDAARLARRYVDYLETLTVEERRRELRVFQRRTIAETRRLIGASG